MKKISIMAYLRNNLGDDLFVSELINRYPNVKFYIEVIDLKYAKAFEKNNNVEISVNSQENFQKIDVNKYDGYVYIGGSIFMEGGQVYNLDETCLEFTKKCKMLNKPFYYISSNYGPYQTQRYFDLSKETFENCTDLCFRDKYSYELFKDINTIRYAPDVLFAYDIGECKKEKDTIGISVIDLDIREKLRYKECEYIKFLVNNIRYYLKNKKEVYLFSFCKIEGDEKAIKKILEKIDESDKNSVHIINYNGNINKFLNVYKKMEYMICQRFHSLVLSYICKQKFYVISYSKKIDNIIEELNLCNEFIRMEEITSNKIIRENLFFNVEEHCLKDIKENAMKQFEKLDEFLKI